jgi:hypothetical protein
MKIDEKYKYVFKKDYDTGEGKLRENDAITQFRGNIYFNGGLVPQHYATMLRKLIENDAIANEYLKKTLII